VLPVSIGNVHTQFHFTLFCKLKGITQQVFEDLVKILGDCLFSGYSRYSNYRSNNSKTCR
jgi:hypothetical protein